MAVPHLLAQGLNGAELELLDGPFGFVQTSGDFFDAALLDEALADDPALIFRKFFDKTEEEGVVFDGFHLL